MSTTATRTARFVHFSHLPLSIRLVFTLTLLVLGTGYLFAMIQVWEVHHGRDGNPMLSAEDIRIAYSGNPEGTRLESSLQGPMRSMLPDSERGTVMGWAAADGSQATYEERIKPIIESRCLACHDGSNPHLPNLGKWDDINQLIQRDTGASIATLVRVSHIHLFGITFIFFIVSSIFTHAYVRPLWMKCVIIAVPFLTILTDIFSWYLTKMVPGFAWVVIISGALMGMSFAAQFLISLYQMWLSSPPQEVLDSQGELPMLI
ncbi:MAG: elongation factor-1 alpha [Thiotrichales bacterium]